MTLRLQNIYPWQQHQWTHLNTLLAQARFPQALLLEGSQHLGKRTFALALAKYLLCIHRSSQACGHCQSCCLVQSDNHPDLHVIQPLEKARVIKIEQVRALVETLSQTSQQGGKRVAVLYPAEAMNTAAANALLKTLEEPQDGVIFLLVSHQPSQIPPTIKSRCQRMRFAVPEPSVTIDWLSEHRPETSEAMDVLLKLAENIPLTALALMENDRLAIHCQVVTHFLDVYLSNLSPSQAATVLLDISAEYVFNALWSVTMEMIRLKSGGIRPLSKLAAAREVRGGRSRTGTYMAVFEDSSTEPTKKCPAAVEFGKRSIEQATVHDQYVEKLRDVSQKIHMRKLFKFIDELIVFKNKIDSKIALNAQLLLEDLLIKWA